MNRFTLAAGCAALTMLVTPAASPAHDRPSPDSVRAHVRSADAALARVGRLVAADRDAAAAAALARNRRQTRDAERDARRVRDVRGRARAVRLVAEQHDENAARYAALVDEVDGRLQTDMARAIGAGVSGREAALTTLTGLVPRLPAAAQRGIARAIADLSDGGGEVSAIADALRSGRISGPAQAHLQAALTRATTAMAAGLERLQGIAATLPGAVAGPVQQVIERISDVLAGIHAGTSPVPSGPAAWPAGPPAPGGSPSPGLPVAGGPVLPVLPIGAGGR